MLIHFTLKLGWQSLQYYMFLNFPLYPYSFFSFACELSRSLCFFHSVCSIELDCQLNNISPVFLDFMCWLLLLLCSRTWREFCPVHLTTQNCTTWRPWTRPVRLNSSPCHISQWRGNAATSVDTGDTVHDHCRKTAAAAKISRGRSWQNPWEIAWERKRERKSHHPTRSGHFMQLVHWLYFISLSACEVLVICLFCFVLL